MAPVRTLDAAIFLLFLTLTVGSVFVSANSGEGETFAEIKAPDGRYLLPLSQDRDLILAGPSGECDIQVRDGAVRVVDSDCPDRICIAMGEVSRPTGWIACLPNRVFIQVVTRGDAADGGEADTGAF